MSSIDQTATNDQLTNETKLVQVILLYRDGYVGLTTAKELAKRYARELSEQINWSSIEVLRRFDA